MRTGHSNGKWWNEANPPFHRANEWGIIRGTKRIAASNLDQVRRSLVRWTHLSPVLVAPPGAENFGPPSAIAEFSDVTKKYRRNQLLSLWILGLGAISMFALSFLAHSAQGVNKLLAFSALVSYIVATMALDYWILRSNKNLTERANFFYWIYTDKSIKLWFVFWCAFVLIMGVSQYILQLRFDLDELVTRYGFFYPKVRDGEYWRVLTGPYFHNGAAHFINNALFLTLAGPITSARFKWIALGSFVLGNIFGGYAQMSLGGHADSYLGVSSGIFSLIGLLVSYAILDKKFLPSGVNILFALTAFGSAVGGLALSNRTAVTAHLVGLAFGAVVACAVRASHRRNQSS